MTCNLFLAKFNHLTPLGLFHFSLQLTDELRHIPEKLMGPASMGFLQNTPQDNLKLDLSLPALLRRWVELEVWRLGVILFMCIPSPGDKNLLSPGDNKHPSPGDKNVPSPGDNKHHFPGGQQSNFPRGQKFPFAWGKNSLLRGQNLPSPGTRRMYPLFWSTSSRADRRRGGRENVFRKI